MDGRRVVYSFLRMQELGGIIRFQVVVERCARECEQREEDCFSVFEKKKIITKALTAAAVRLN